jgi:NADPH-dependent 2,4-dienoyl-CoA reductase/sulfur reductase-like enzyme
MTERLVVIGGDAAGMGAASQARRLDPDLEIIALERSEYTSYSACGIPYLVSGDVDDVDQLVVRTPQEFRDRQRIDVRVRHEVMGIDLDGRKLEVRDHEHGRSLHLGFDQLMLGMGAVPRRPDVPGVDLPHVHGVQTLAEGERLLAEAERSACQHVVVVGGGYIGLEIAEAFVRWGAEVTVLEAAPQVLGPLDADMAELVVTAMRRHDIEVRTDCPLTAIEPGRVQTVDGDLPADLVVLGMGVDPNTALATEADIPTGVRGAVKVDRRQHAGVDGVWAAGDCCESFHLVSRTPTYVALGTIANRQARVAGINLGGGYASFPGVVGTAITKLCSTEIGRTGLNEREARQAGFTYALGKVESTTRAGYFPGAEMITAKVLVERGSGRVLGAQLVGGPGTAKRIDAAAVSIGVEASVDDVLNFDFGYAPPFGPLWDPFQAACRAALRG